MSRTDQATVLLVDDNEATCTLVTAILRSDFAIDIARDGSEGIAKLGSRKYASILLDLKMPHVDGFAVLDYLQASSPDMLPRVLVFTAAGEREIKRLAAYEVCGIVSKPFEVDELLAAVKNCAYGEGGDRRFSDVFGAGPAVLLLLADFLRQRLP